MRWPFSVILASRLLQPLTITHGPWFYNNHPSSKRPAAASPISQLLCTSNLAKSNHYVCVSSCIDSTVTYIHMSISCILPKYYLKIRQGDFGGKMYWSTGELLRDLQSAHTRVPPPLPPYSSNQSLTHPFSQGSDWGLIDGRGLIEAWANPPSWVLAGHLSPQTLPSPPDLIWSHLQWN